MIVVDTHVHLYSCYDFEAAVNGCVTRLGALAPGADCVGVLAERAGSRMFRSLKEQSGVEVAEDIRVTRSGDGECLLLHCFNRPPLILCPGRQIVTAERLEILCLADDAEIPDGLPAETVVQRIREVDGVPVLTWAVGKWLFRRAPVVRKLLERFGPEQLLIGDSALRPSFWPTPRPMREAHRRGYRVLAGTDPLPSAGEEAVMGTYASVLEGAVNPDDALTSLRKALLAINMPIRNVGKRSGPIEFFRRLGSTGGVTRPGGGLG